jgi:gluconate 2-dehydrogenase gamma chain
LPHSPVDRRSLLAFSAAACAAPLASAAAQLSGAGMIWQANAAAYPTAVDLSAHYTFFTPAEAGFVEAACARIIPADERGPGALEAGVPLFLDRQLAGDYGSGARWYMQGPWPKGLPSQGYQSRHPPAELYRVAIGEIEQAAGASFAGLPAAQQDALLKRLEAGSLELATVDGKAFFALMLQNVMEGFFSDPLYGGNRGMAGWRMIGFPGARYDYRPYLMRHGQPFPLPPTAIAGRAAWSPAGRP